MSAILEKLNIIQSKLKAPKGQYNKFGDYPYRSCEDILEALKPLLAETKTVLVISDEIEFMGDRFYIRATCNLFDVESGENISSSAFAREPEIKKKMDAAQITGSASSYARKYALNGLFTIDDTKDSDSNEEQGQTNSGKPTNGNGQAVNVQKVRNEIAQMLKVKNYDFNKFIGYLKQNYGVEKIEALPVEKLMHLKSTVASW
jgi:hypothetical protein